MAVTKEQIFAAADQIAASGQRPTLEAVRQIVGGSYTTISPALNEWKSKQATGAAPLREPAPQAVADRLAEVGAEIWAAALELANARLATEREATEKARTDMEVAQAETTELADRNDADRLRDQLTAAQEQAHTAEARAVEIERRAGELRTELDRAHQDADQVRGELVKAQAKTEAEQETHQEQRKQAAAEAHRVAERMTKAEADRDTARKEAGQAREDAARLVGQIQAHQEQTATLLARLAPPADGKPATRKKDEKGTPPA